MERTAALALLSRIEAYYSPDRPFRGPVSDAWLELLERCEEGAAGTALARLKSSNVPATPASFEQQYRTLRMVDGGTKKPGCELCDGCGWVQADPIIMNAGTDHERTYSACEPCVCSEGKLREQSAVWRERGAA